MAPKRIPTQTATVHSTDTDTSAEQANNQAVTRRDLDMLAQSLTTAFAEQLRAALSTNAPAQNQQTLDDMAAQIENLRKRIDPIDPSPSQRQRESSQKQDSKKQTDPETMASRSSHRNWKKRERVRRQKSSSFQDESRTQTQDAREYLNRKRSQHSESTQAMIDRKREERKAQRLSGSSHSESAVRPPIPVQAEISLGGPQDAPIMLNSPLSAEILATPNPAKIKVPSITPFDGTTCPEEHIVAYKNLMLLYTTNQALLCKFFPTTLSGIALSWYTSLPSGTIHTFAQLETKFVNHFVAS
ncbi:unnamed protein product, partial [Amaranthus hypochondriacus]